MELVSDRDTRVRSSGERPPTRAPRQQPTTAHRKAIDRIRRESKRGDKHREAQMAYDDNPPEPLDATNAIDDERLRLNAGSAV
jgi:RNA polymerase sigma-70 factor (ECF subfamily)